MTNRLFHRSFITENSEERILASFYTSIWIFEIATWWCQPSHWMTLALQMVWSAIKTAKHIIPWKEVLLWWKLRTIYSKDTRPCREDSVFFKLFWGTKTVSQIPPTVSQNIVTWDHINGERSLKFLQAVS